MEEEIKTADEPMNEIGMAPNTDREMTSAR